MEEPKHNLPNPKDLEKMRRAMEQQADELAEDTTQNFTIGQDLLNPEEITPEMIQQLMANARQQLSRGYFCRTGPSHLSRSERRAQRKRQRKARAITRRAGMGRTITHKKRLKKAL